ncbi:hypothetical protein [Paenibacillus senegalensis]|nr:hypothetical protein [Paenibacillus senegalensis]
MNVTKAQLRDFIDKKIFDKKEKLKKKLKKLQRWRWGTHWMNY